jgi:hypothetical protein
MGRLLPGGRSDLLNASGDPAGQGLHDTPEGVASLLTMAECVVLSKQHEGRQDSSPLVLYFIYASKKMAYFIRPVPL